MEIDITEFYNTADTRQFCNSIANSGDLNIGEKTFSNALQATLYAYILPKEATEIFREFISDMGMSDTDNLNKDELTAVFIQLISGDIQEKGKSTWDEYQKDEQVAGRLFENDGNIHYYIGT
jgi:hypothetical protein